MGVRALRRLIVLMVLIGASVSADALEITYKTEASARINYAVDQVREACDEVSAKGAVIVSVQGVGKADNLRP